MCAQSIERAQLYHVRAAVYILLEPLGAVAPLSLLHFPLEKPEIICQWMHIAQPSASDELQTSYFFYISTVLTIYLEEMAASLN